ncbi:MAG: hypothetical protein WBA67_18025 [Jannaschia sp.]
MADIDTNPATEMFSVQIRRSSEDAPFRLLSADVVRPGFRHRLSFARDNTLREVLQPQLAKFVQNFLDDVIDSGPRVIAQPDVTMTVPGLVLGRMRAIIGAPVGETRQVTLRFRYFIGGIQNAFSSQTYFDRPALSHREEICMRTLEDVAVPLLNMALTAKTWPEIAGQSGSGATMASALASIEAHAIELEFYAGLLRRYVTECGPCRMEELGRFEDPVLRMMQMSEPPVLALRGLPPGKTAS